jgi:hypothetical protein
LGSEASHQAAKSATPIFSVEGALARIFHKKGQTSSKSLIE